MRNYYQYILLGFVALLSLVACEKSDIESAVDSSLSAEAETHEVRLVLTDGATRAHFEQNEGNTRATVTNDGRFLWQSGDRFRLYAHKSDGSNAFPADSYIDFSYWISTTSAGRSFFRGTITEDMSDGSYTYYAVYPHSTPVEGTTATFTLPATQSGEYSRYDFMVARSTAANSATASGNALQAIQDNDRNTPEPMNDIALSFRHKLHALRFEIPSQGVLSSGIRRVHILFSEAVVGDVVVNMATDEVSYTNMTNKITVDFGAGNEKHSGDVFWVMTLPQTSFSRAVDIRFEDSNGNFTTRQLVTFPSSQQYTAGRLTPIKINVPTQYVGYTYLDATTVDTNLGEPVTHLHLDLPVGYYFPDYSQKYIAAENGEIHTFTLFNDIIDKTFRDSNITLTYESDHALIPTTTSFGDGLKVGQRNQYYGLETPWLFYEDFSGVSTREYNGTDGWGSTINPDAYKTDDMSAVGLLGGWSGSRCDAFAGTDNIAALRLRTYLATSTVWDPNGGDNAEARIDTPFLLYIKDNEEVNLKVEFDIAGTVYRKNSSVSSKWLQMSSAFKFGIETTGGVINYDQEISTTVQEATLAGENGTYKDGYTHYAIPVSRVTNQHRLSWLGTYIKETHADGSGVLTITSKTQYIYLDNIKVSIAQ